MQMDLDALLDGLARLSRFDLSQPYLPGIPHFPTHPPYGFTLTKLHGESVRPNGSSSAADMIALGTHTGTHIDALCHFSCGGLLYGGVPVEGLQSPERGIARHGIETMALLLRRGVLLDVAALVAGDGELVESFPVTAEVLERACQRTGAVVRAGDVVLIRTGWGRYWRNPRKFLNELRLPGATLDAAEWLSAKGIRAAGSDTVAFERMPSPNMDVHVHLLVECGIHIVENLALEALAEAQVTEFIFLAAPLSLTGATGSPLRPYALAEP